MSNISPVPLDFEDKVLFILLLSIILLVIILLIVYLIKRIKCDMTSKKLQVKLMVAENFIKAQEQYYKQELVNKNLQYQIQLGEVTTIKNQTLQLQKNYHDMMLIKDKILKETQMLLLEKQMIAKTKEVIDSCISKGIKQPVAADVGNNNKNGFNEWLDIAKECFEAFLKHGIEIYKWEKPCWKCKKTTHIISYYLYYNARKLTGHDMPLRTVPFEAGLSYISILDDYLLKKYSSIKLIHSNTVNETYIANVCEHCGATQGRNYNVDDPHEIFNELTKENGMDKYIMEVVDVGKLNVKYEDILPFFDIENAGCISQTILL